MKIDFLVSDTYIGRTLNTRRIRKGMLLKDAAKALGMSPQFLCELEHGKKRWLATDVSRYCSVLK